MNLSDYLSSHAVRQGKTHNLAQLVKQVGGTLIVRNQTEATRIEREYAIRAIPYDAPISRFVGCQLGITYVDPDAVGLWTSRLQSDLRIAKRALEDIEDYIDRKTGRYPEISGDVIRAIINQTLSKVGRTW